MECDRAPKIRRAIVRVYNTASNALMVAQEGERRAHGFDYRDQRKGANAEAQDHARKAELMTEIAGLIDIITSTEPEIVEGEFHQHTDDDEGHAAGSDSPGSRDA